MHLVILPLMDSEVTSKTFRIVDNASMSLCVHVWELSNEHR